MPVSTQLKRLTAIFLTALLLQPGGAATAASIRSFNIARQPLTSALLEYGRQSGYSIGFTEELTAGKVARGLVGRYREEDALRRLLAGTGLTFRHIDAETLAVMSRFDAQARVAAGESERRSRDLKAPQLPSATGRPGRDATPAMLPSAVNKIDEVIVVGTQLPGAELSESLPITVWEADRLAATGAVHGGDIFRALPFAGAVSFNGVDTFFAGVNSARGDIASINLRDLGTGNTLVLLNGRRMVVHPGVQTELRVPAMTANMNVLPVQALKRVEILRDGASAVYGADAVAGVINNVLRTGYDGLGISAFYGVAEETGLAETEFNFRAGTDFNDGASHIQLFAAHIERDGIDAAARPYSKSSNLQPLLAGTEFADDANFNNASISGSWGQFRLSTPVSRNGQMLTSPTGIFHLQPATFSGCNAAISEAVCVDDSFIDTALYGDHNSSRQLIPDLQRSTVVVTARHSLKENAEFYGELLYYHADSSRTTGASAPLPSTPIIIPADNYWNPFGPTRFADGRSNPNRLPGIDAPEEGLSIVLDSSYFGSAYRVADAGRRLIEVGNQSIRTLAGIRGELSGWQYDSAVLFSEAETRDVTHNRISNSLFQEALARDTPLAYNPFNGSNPDAPGSLIDGVPNAPEVLLPFLVDVSRVNRSSLTLADFKLASRDWLRLPSGAVSASVGVESRHETFAEDRDPRFDGTIMFTDQVSGRTFESDVMGSSVTADSAGSRDVFSVFGELAVPLVGAGNNVPLVESLEVQLAARYEDYSDVGDAFQPRISFAWHLVDDIAVRGSYSRGVRAPNLPQLNAGETRRVLTATDWYRCNALLNRGEIGSLGACGAAGQVLIESSRSGSQNLRPEKYTSTSIGLAYFPEQIRGLFASIDFWRIRQNGIIGLFGAENQLAADYAERISGDTNPHVLRDDVTVADVAFFANSGLEPAGQVVQIHDAYVNLDRRISSGVDFSFNYFYDNWFLADVYVDLDATRLIKAEQSLPVAAAHINALSQPAIAVRGAGNLMRRDGRPDWKIAADLGLRRNDWRAGVTGNYVSRFSDTSAVSDVSGRLFTVDHWITMGAYFEIDTALFGDMVGNVRFGARNILNADPPLADESFGFNAAMHESYGRFWYLRLSTDF